MSRVVFDASAILAAVNREPGGDLVVKYTESSVVSTVNLAEVQGKLVTRGIPSDDAWEAALSFCNEVAPFDSHQARLTGALLSSTQTLGLSLGDRACLALGILLEAPVYTADRQWKRLSLGVEIRLLR